MKKIYLSACLAAFLIGGTSCLNDEFLDKYPIDKETENTVFTTYDNFKMYAWGLYNKTLIAYQNYPQAGDVSDMLFDSNDARGIAWANNRMSASNVSADTWTFEFIRRVNLMLDNIENSQMTEKEKAHWRGVGYFFRAHEYFKLLQKFGDLPWLEHLVGTGDVDVLYAKQDSREVVANHMLENLLYAEEHINEKGDGDNTVNPNVVRAFISRFGLYEGTWRKYHGSVDNVDGTKYLVASVKASQILMVLNLGLMADYDDVFNSSSLKGQSSILLYREYLENESGKGHDLTQRTTGERLYEGSKKLVEQYLCADGRPISTSTVYDGDNTVYDEFRNRDLRLYYTICPPYKVTVSTDLSHWEYTGNAVEREYMDLMGKLSKNNPERKMLPLSKKASYIANIPNLTAVKVSGVDTQTGYFMYKYYNALPGADKGEVQGTDGPIFRMGEVLINHAEAMFELGRFDQSVADATVNKLRARAGVAAMVINNIGADFDKFRDSDVAPVLWEIRRERCSELMGSGFRFDDIKRWKKGNYLNEQPVGVKINNIEDYNSEALAKSLYKGSEMPRYVNCVTYIEKPNPGWEDKCYLYPIPLKQTLLNENLVQNPGWK